MENKKALKVKLGDYIDTLKGYAFKSNWYCDTGVPLVKVSDFTNDSINNKSTVYIPEDIARDYQKYQISEGDVIIQTVGSWPRNPESVVGKVIRVPKECSGALLNQNAVKLIPHKEINKSYLYYLLRSNFFKDYIINTAQGAANQASITLESIKGFNFDLPSLMEQNKISILLKSYDDFIDNNARKIKILNSMIKIIYDEWFVKFKFPNHENFDMVDFELGEIPEGWSLGKVADLYRVQPGFAFKSKDFQQKGYPVIKITNIKEDNSVDIDRTVKIEENVAMVTEKFKLEPGDILIAMTGATIGKAGIMPRTEKPCYLNQRVARLIPIDSNIGLSYIYCITTSERFRKIIENISLGAAQPNISGGTIESIEILVPDKKVLTEFSKLLSPIFENILCLRLKNQIYVKIRDLLIPKLISDEIDVSNIDIKVTMEAT